MIVNFPPPLELNDAIRRRNEKEEREVERRVDTWRRKRQRKRLLIFAVEYIVPVLITVAVWWLW